MVSLSIAKTVIEILSGKPEKRMTARDIANEIMQTYPAEVEEKRKRSRATKIPLNTDDAMLQQLVAEIGAQRTRIQEKEDRIKTTEGRPKKYYYTEKSDEDEIDNSQDTLSVLEISSDRMAETHLYPMLSEFLLLEQSIHSMRVDEKRSKNNRGRGGNKWLYPPTSTVKKIND